MLIGGDDLRDDSDAKDAVKAWGELFPHRGARMDRTDEEKTQRAEREHLVDYLLRAFAVPATADAASAALQAIGYVAHLPSKPAAFHSTR